MSLAATTGAETKANNRDSIEHDSKFEEVNGLMTGIACSPKKEYITLTVSSSSFGRANSSIGGKVIILDPICSVRP